MAHDTFPRSHTCVSKLLQFLYVYNAYPTLYIKHMKIPRPI
jgi:hypothetical protein